MAPARACTPRMRAPRRTAPRGRRGGALARGLGELLLLHEAQWAHLLDDLRSWDSLPDSLTGSTHARLWQAVGLQRASR